MSSELLTCHHFTQSVDTDVLDQYDRRDPSTATPETRQRASEACTAHREELKLSHTLSGLKVGIPQVSLYSPISKFNP